MFQKTWKAGRKVRENEGKGITFLEHGLATRARPCASEGVAIALGPEARKAWERAGSYFVRDIRNMIKLTLLQMPFF